MPAMAYMGGRTEAIGCCLDFLCVCGLWAQVWAWSFEESWTN
jgi:hypothetical protein